MGNKTKFTKGKWNQSHRHVGGGMYSTQVYDNTGETICTLAWHAINTESGIRTDRSANADLIKTAPKLYEALRAISEGEGLQPGTTIERLLAEARGE